MSEAAVEAPEAVETVDTEATAEPVEAVETEATVEAPASPDFSQILQSPEGRAALSQATEEQLAAMFHEEPEAPADPLAGFDFLDDDAPQKLAQTLADFKQQILDEVHKSPAVQHADQEYARQWADQQFSSIEGTLGAGVKLDDEARNLAIFASQGIASAPDYRGDGAATLRDTATQLHQYVSKREQAAVEAYKRSLAGDDTDGGNEPTASGAAVVRTEELPGSMSEATDRVLTRLGLKRDDTLR